VSAVADLFPAGGYRFHLTLRRQEPAEFFRAQDSTGSLLREKRRWLTTDPRRHAALLPEGRPLLDEFAVWAAAWATPDGAKPGPTGPGASIHEVGSLYEPDILFLTADAAGQFRLRAGIVCFPSGWALEEKLGHPLEFIHDVVPGLNAALGASIQQFLSRLRPGSAYFRANWGLAATADLNLHPARGIQPPIPPVQLDRLWIRVEEQVLLSLPQTRGIVFGIRIALQRLDELVRDPAAAAGLRESLRTMPAAMAAYKGIEQIRTELIERL